MAAEEKFLERSRKEEQRMEKKTGRRLGKERGLAFMKRGKNRFV